GSNRVRTWWQRVLVSFAGPLAGFIFLGLIILGTHLASPQHLEAYLTILGWNFGLIDSASLQAIPNRELFAVLIQPTFQDTLFFDLFFINLLWGLLNLLPIWPLDGGQISRDVFTQVSHERGLQVSLGISFLVAAVLAINAVVGMNSPSHKGFIPYLPPGG